MGLIDCASGQSTWYGYEYYKGKKVVSYKRTAESEYEGTVRGTNIYQVKIYIDHPRRSACNCPFAKGRRVVCKHMVAVYFTIFPEEADRYIKRVNEQEKEAEQWQEQLGQRVEKYVAKLSKEQLRSELLTILFDGPDWIYDRFIREHGIDE